MKAQHQGSSNPSEINPKPRGNNARGSFTPFGRGSLTQKIAVTIGAAFMLGTALLGSALAAPTRADWCGVIWTIENVNGTLGWMNAGAATPVLNTSTGPTANIPTLPGTITGGSVAALGVHTQSGTFFIVDRSSNTLYKWRPGFDTVWTSITTTGLPAANADNLNKLTVDGNTLYIANSVADKVYSFPLVAATGALTSTVAVPQTFTFTGEPSAYVHSGTGTGSIAGGDITTDEYGDTYNITYNTPTTKAFFYVQSGTNWVYQGEVAATAAFAGAAFYKGDLYVKASTQLQKLDLTRNVANTGYTGWSNALINIGAATTTGSTDLTSCGTPIVTITKTQQIYTDAALTTLSSDQVNVKTGQYIKYTVVSQNTGDTWARSTVLSDTLPVGAAYLPNTSTLNGVNLNQASYPTSFTLTSSGAPTGNVRFSPDPNTATLTFAVQVIAQSGSVQNRATVAYIDSAGLASDPSDCNSTPKVNCGVSPNVPVVALEGLVWKDANRNGLLDNSETIWDGSLGVLTVYVVNSSNLVVAKTTVLSNGTFAFNGLTAGTYTVILSTNSSIAIGATPPVASLPVGWGNTAETTGAATSGTTDGTADGKISVTIP